MRLRIWEIQGVEIARNARQREHACVQARVSSVLHICKRIKGFESNSMANFANSVRDTPDTRTEN